jgi:hypothetical protein
VAVPVAPGGVYIYRNHYFNQQNNKTTPVQNMAALDADTTGKVYYREGDMVYLKMTLLAEELSKANAYGAYTYYHLCATLECK